MSQRRKLIEVALPLQGDRALGAREHPAGAAQKIAGLARQVLVDLEPHATPRRPISTMRSRATSAA